MDLVIRAALVLVFAAGCSVSVGADQPWVPLESIVPPLQPDMAALPLTQTAPGTPDVLRVVTYNIDEEDPAMTREAIAAAIQGDPNLASAGLYIFQEEEAYPEEGATRSAQLAKLLGLGYVYLPARVKGTGTHGLALMSPYPIENVQKMDLPFAGVQQRIAVSADIRVGAHVLHVIDIHLDPAINASERVAQLRPAVIDVQGPVLVAGDFNTSWVEWLRPGVPVVTGSSAVDQAPVIDDYMRTLGYQTPTVNSGATAFAKGYEARLDSFYPRGLEVTFGAVDRVGPSDHWPLWMDVTLP